MSFKQPSSFSNFGDNYLLRELPARFSASSLSLPPLCLPTQQLDSASWYMYGSALPGSRALSGPLPLALSHTQLGT